MPFHRHPNVHIMGAEALTFLEKLQGSMNLSNQKLMTSELATVFAQKAEAAASASEAARKRWNLFEAWRQNGRAGAYLDAGRRILSLARSL